LDPFETISKKYQFKFLKHCGRGRWDLFQKTATQTLHYTVNAPNPEIGGSGKAEKTQVATAIPFSGCPGLSFEAQLPFHGVREGFAVF